MLPAKSSLECGARSCNAAIWERTQECGGDQLWRDAAAISAGEEAWGWELPLEFWTRVDRLGQSLRTNRAGAARERRGKKAQPVHADQRGVGP